MTECEESRKVREGFNACSHAPNAEERVRILDQIGNEDSVIRLEIESLLEFAIEFPENLTGDEFDLDELEADELIGVKIGGYRVERLLAEGGMGEV